MAANDETTKARAAYVASVRLGFMLDNLQRITQATMAPQHKHADRVQKVLEEWHTEALLAANRYIHEEGPDTEKA